MLASALERSDEPAEEVEWQVSAWPQGRSWMGAESALAKASAEAALLTEASAWAPEVEGHWPKMEQRRLLEWWQGGSINFETLNVGKTTIYVRDRTCHGVSINGWWGLWDPETLLGILKDLERGGLTPPGSWSLFAVEEIDVGVCAAADEWSWGEESKCLWGASSNTDFLRELLINLPSNYLGWAEA